MKFQSKLSTVFGALLLAIALFGGAGALAPIAHAQAATAQSATADKDAAKSEDQEEQFRHAPAVEHLARMAHMSTDGASRIFEIINSGILIGAILWFAAKLLPKILRQRSETLQKQLLDARLATTRANERLAVVEERLSKLGIEIDSIRRQTEADSVEDEKRIQAALEIERQRIVASAEQEIDAAGAAAQRELKKFAADLSVDRALKAIRLSADEDRVLIHSFSKDLYGENKGERN